MGPVVLDTSILSAVVDPSDAHHEAAAAELIACHTARRPIRVSAITVAEFHSVKGPARQARLEWAERFIESIGPDGVVSVDRRAAELAGELRARRPSVKLLDALIKGSADRIGGELITADRRLARLDGVRYVGATGAGGTSGAKAQPNPTKRRTNAT